MESTLLTKIHQLHRPGGAELAALYKEVCGEAPRSRHRDFLERRIAWALQAEAEGGLGADAECEIIP